MAASKDCERFDSGDWALRAESLVRICEAGAWSADRQSVYSNLCDAVKRELKGDAAYLHLLSADGSCLVRCASGADNLLALAGRAKTLSLKTGRIELLLGVRKPILMDYEHPHEQDVIPREAAKLGYRCAISIPVMANGSVFGMCSVSFVRRIEWTEDDLRFLDEVSRVLGVIVDRVRASCRRTELALLEERARLSSEIHDNVSHAVGSLSLFSGSVLASYEEGDYPAMEKSLEKLEKACGETMRVFRDEMMSLRIPLERTREWDRNVETILENFEKEWGIRARLVKDVKSEPLTVNTEVSLQLARILNECLSNAMRHSGASEVTVFLREDDEILHMAVSDNGCGFKMADVAPERLGLKIMKERACAIGGDLSIRSSSKGTVVSLEVPYLGAR